MKVYIKNKFWSLGGASEVLNEKQQPVFKVKGKIFSITRKKTVCDLQGNKLFKVRNKWFNFFVHKAYIYDKDKNRICTVKDKWANFNNEYFIEGYKNEIKLQGKFFSTKSHIIRNGTTIGTITRKLMSIKDSFELDASPKDIPFCIALVIALDNIVDKKY